MQKANANNSLLNRYKSIFIRSRNLIISPKKEWSKIFKENDDFNKIISEFTLPYLAIITVISFISSLTNIQEPDFQSALKKGLSEFASLFFGLLLIYYIVVNIIPKFYKNTKSTNYKQLAIKITAYSYVALYILQILSLLIPQVIFLQILSVYAAYLIWIATKEIGDFESKDLRVVFTIIVSLLLLFVPFFISRIILQFSNGIFN